MTDFKSLKEIHTFMIVEKGHLESGDTYKGVGITTWSNDGHYAKVESVPSLWGANNSNYIPFEIIMFPTYSVMLKNHDHRRMMGVYFASDYLPGNIKSFLHQLMQGLFEDTHNINYNWVLPILSLYYMGNDEQRKDAGEIIDYMKNIYKNDERLMGNLNVEVEV